MEVSCKATAKQFLNLSVQPRNLSALLVQALPKLMCLRPTLHKKFSIDPPPMDATLPELPQDILMDIFTQLEIPDLVRAASVCPSWCSAYTSLCNLGQYKQSQTPCLLYTCGTDSESDARLYNLAEKRSYKLTLPGPPIRSRYLIGSSNGWLVTADDRSEMHLLNPITVEQIALPSVITLEPVAPILDETGAVYKYNFWNRATRPPTTFALDELRRYLHRKAFVFYDTSAKRYIVVLIHNPERQLSFSWLGDDKWTLLPTPKGIFHFHDCVYMDDLLYVVAARGEIFAFNLRGPIVTKKLILDRAKNNICENIYIVQAPCGDLLQVWRLEDDTVYDEDVNDATYETHTGKIDIFKVDTTAEKLVKINSLDDHVLVLGHNQSLCLTAEEYPQLKANRVYFTDDHELYIFGWKNNRRDIGVFDLENNSREELVSPQLWSNWPPPIWVTPALTELCPTKVPPYPTPASTIQFYYPASLRAAYIFFCITIISAYLISWCSIL
ncbi:putative F-box protein At4g22180 [Lolium rigidum]|uniref:putative F-box protein At4g22180 n=1 Tax=Lolium rigidum TaxID=89674 RepID=UPI001F5D158A|nr:putative F-box protein At4g22180 [Lolium rigidum]